MGKSFLSRKLGQSDISVSSLGLGGWTMGGPFYSGAGCAYPIGQALGYGEVDDAISIRAIHCALDAGITLFDTADAYGTGRGERVLGQALKVRREVAVIATKVGNTYNEQSLELTGTNVTPEYIRTACEASLKRLDTGWIDLYQLHVGKLSEEEAKSAAGAMEDLCDEGLIRAYGWSTDDASCAAMFGGYSHAVAIQHDMNVFQDAPEILDVCETNGFASINRCPLGMGFLSGKFTIESRLPANDIRAKPPEWLPYFNDGGSASEMWLTKLGQIKEILMSDGRSLTQGAIAWLWARGDYTIPIPGARTEGQVVENAKAMLYGPLLAEQMNEIDIILNRNNS